MITPRHRDRAADLVVRLYGCPSCGAKKHEPCRGSDGQAVVYELYGEPIYLVHHERTPPKACRVAP